MTWNRDSSIDVLIPARDEELALPQLLAEIDRTNLRHILVVDNGSSDRTARLAREQGAIVIFCKQAGYGRACLAGMEHMSRNPPDILVFLDGDRSDHPRYIQSLCTPIIEGSHDMVLTSRTLGQAEAGSLTMTQVFGNRLATSLMRFFWNTDYTDLGPFRAIRWDALKALEMNDTNYGWTIEMQIKAACAALRVLEIPVDYRNRIGVSKISGTLSGVIKAGTKIIYTIFKYRLLTRSWRSGRAKVRS